MGEVRATRTLTVDLRRLERTGPDGVLSLRIMRAANDLGAANAGWRQANREFSRLERHMQDGIRRYYIRLQCGHLVEAMGLIPGVEASPRLPALSAVAQRGLGRRSVGWSTAPKVTQGARTSNATSSVCGIKSPSTTTPESQSLP